MSRNEKKIDHKSSEKIKLNLKHAIFLTCDIWMTTTVCTDGPDVGAPGAILGLNEGKCVGRAVGATCAKQLNCTYDSYSE